MSEKREKLFEVSGRWWIEAGSLDEVWDLLELEGMTSVRFEEKEIDVEEVEA